MWSLLFALNVCLLSINGSFHIIFHIFSSFFVSRTFCCSLFCLFYCFFLHFSSFNVVFPPFFELKVSFNYSYLKTIAWRRCDNDDSEDIALSVTSNWCVESFIVNVKKFNSIKYMNYMLQKMIKTKSKRKRASETSHHTISHERGLEKHSHTHDSAQFSFCKYYYYYHYCYYFDVRARLWARVCVSVCVCIKSKW